MGLPLDPIVRLQCFRNALRNWRFEGYVDIKRTAREWLSHEVPEYSLRQIREELHRYVENGGKVIESPETRPEFVHWEFHFDLRGVRFGDRVLYFETVLMCDDSNDSDDPRIVIVSVHDV